MKKKKHTSNNDEMKKGEIAKKNLDLHCEWLRYVTENPDIIDDIPKGATLVILPEDNIELFNENMKIVQQRKKEGVPVVVIKMKTPVPIGSNP